MEPAGARQTCGLWRGAEFLSRLCYDQQPVEAETRLFILEFIIEMFVFEMSSTRLTLLGWRWAAFEIQRTLFTTTLHSKISLCCNCLIWTLCYSSEGFQLRVDLEILQPQESFKYLKIIKFLIPNNNSIYAGAV